MKQISEMLRPYNSPEWITLITSLDIIIDVKIAYGDNIFKLECNWKCPMRDKKEEYTGQGEAICTCGRWRISRLMSEVVLAKLEKDRGEQT